MKQLERERVNEAAGGAQATAERPPDIRKGRRPKAEQLDEKRMSLVGHLSELRNRLIFCLVAFLAATAVSLYYAEWFTDLLISLGDQFSFVYIAPAELMLSYFRVAFVGGTVAALPVIVYHVWQFIRPGLKKKEKLGAGIVMTFGLGLFALGACFAFSVVIPILLGFYARLDTTHTVTAMVSIQEYISYVLSTMTTFGIIFECPIVILTLVAIGIIKPATLQKNFKYVVLIVAAVAAIITPPDVTSQILVAVPLLLLLEVSILASAVLFRKRLARAAAEEKAK